MRVLLRARLYQFSRYNWPLYVARWRWKAIKAVRGANRASRYVEELHGALLRTQDARRLLFATLDAVDDKLNNPSNENGASRQMGPSWKFLQLKLDEAKRETAQEIGRFIKDYEAMAPGSIEGKELDNRLRVLYSGD